MESFDYNRSSHVVLFGAFGHVQILKDPKFGFRTNIWKTGPFSDAILLAKQMASFNLRIQGGQNAFQNSERYETDALSSSTEVFLRAHFRSLAARATGTRPGRREKRKFIFDFSQNLNSISACGYLFFKFLKFKIYFGKFYRVWSYVEFIM